MDVLSTFFAITVVAVLLDLWLGEPNRYHPLVGFGKFADALEARFHRGAAQSHNAAIMWGAIALLGAIIPFVLVAVFLEWLLEGVAHWVASVLVLYLAIGHASLRTHAQAVATALGSEDITQARRAVGCLVSRNTETLDEQQISAATIESVLENGSDAVFGALFWFAVAGMPGVVMYRLANTLDAMWGYKNARYLYFGRVAALFDDALNYLPARLTAISYALLGNYNSAIECWKTQGTGWKSPNAGPVMAAGAGALNVELGGSATYHGEQQYRPLLGCGSPPFPSDIHRALTLIYRGIVLWLLTFAFLSLVAL